MQEIIDGAKYCVNRDGTCGGCKYLSNGRCGVVEDTELIVKTIIKLSEPKINDFLSLRGKKYWRVYKRKTKTKGTINTVSLISFEYLCGLISTKGQVGEIYEYEERKLAEKRAKELNDEEEKL